MNKLSALLLLILALWFVANFQAKETPALAGRSAITMRLDYAGIEAIINVLEKDSLTDADVLSSF